MLSSMLSRAFHSRTLPGTLRWALPKALPGAAVVVVMAAGLSACGPDRPQFAPACPQTGILSDAADITTFRGTGTDLTDMVVDGRITGLSGKCSSPDMDHLQTQISVNMELGRGPAMQGRVADVAYFVSVARGDTILDKRVYTLHVAFDNTGSRVRLTGDLIDIALPIAGKVTGADYRILVGFQLSPAELAFNRRRGPR